LELIFLILNLIDDVVEVEDYLLLPVGKWLISKEKNSHALLYLIVNLCKEFILV